MRPGDPFRIRIPTRGASRHSLARATEARRRFFEPHGRRTVVRLDQPVLLFVDGAVAGPLLASIDAAGVWVVRRRESDFAGMDPRWLRLIEAL